MLMLVPGGQIAALGYLIGAVLNFVLPSIYPNGHASLGFTSQQWGIICLVMAF